MHARQRVRVEDSKIILHLRIFFSSYEREARSKRKKRKDIQYTKIYEENDIKVKLITEIKVKRQQITTIEIRKLFLSQEITLRKNS